MEGQTIESDKLSFVENITKFRATKEPINSSGLKLVSAANNHRMIFIGLEDRTVRAISTEHLIGPSKSSARKILSLDQFIYSHQLTFRPTILSVSRQGYSSVLLIVGVSGPAKDVANGSAAGHEINFWPTVELFDIDSRESIGKLELKEFSRVRIIDYSWHPTYYESIVVLCTDNGHLLVVGFNRKDKRVALVYKNDHYAALTCCWSPKGKHLAVGMSSGKIVRLEPVITTSSLTFEEVKNSTLIFTHDNITPQHQVIKLRWLVKTTLICVHARAISLINGEPNGPDTIYSIVSIKPGKPYKYWTNLCFEKVENYYDVQLVNLLSHVICTSNSSSEAAVLGAESKEEAKVNEPNNWKSIVIGGEGDRIELPLDDNNRETFSRGVTVTLMQDNSNQGVINRPVLVFYSSDGVLCPFSAIHTESILELPELQKLEECPLNIPKPLLENQPKPINLVQNQTKSSTPVGHQVNSITLVEQQTNSIRLAEHQTKSINQVGKSVKDLKESIKQNETKIRLLGDINTLRAQFDEIQDIHATHREALSAIKADIDKLDLGMLENLYLVEFIKSKSKKTSRKKFVNPRVVEKVEGIKQKTREISEKLRDLNANVDVSWEDFLRRRNALETKNRRLNSLDMIYKTLATNQKIINLLKKKSGQISSLVPALKMPQINNDTARPELDPAKMRALREFLASRTVVPVRRPD